MRIYLSGRAGCCYRTDRCFIHKKILDFLAEKHLCTHLNHPHSPICRSQKKKREVYTCNWCFFNKLLKGFLHCCGLIGYYYFDNIFLFFFSLVAWHVFVLQYNPPFTIPFFGVYSSNSMLLLERASRVSRLYKNMEKKWGGGGGGGGGARVYLC